MTSKTNLSLNKEITMGNIVSWSLILIAFVFGYAQMKGTVLQAESTAREAKIVSTSAKDQIYALKTDIEVIRVTTVATDKKVDELRSMFMSRGLVRNE